MSISSVTIGRPVSSLASAQQAQPLVAEALEAVRGGPGLVGAAAQHRARPPAFTASAVASSCSRLSTVHGPAIREKLPPPTLRPSTSTTVGTPCLNCDRGQLVRLRDRHDAVDAVGPLEIEVGDPLAVADRADHGQHLALGDVRMSADRLHALDHGVDLLLRGLLFHDDHHRRVPSRKLFGFLAGYPGVLYHAARPHREAGPAAGTALDLGSLVRGCAGGSNA